MKTTPVSPAFSNSRISRAVLASLLATLGSAAFAQEIWDGGGGDNNWATGNNWADNSAPSGSTGVALTFSGATQTTNVNNISGLGFTSLTLNTSNWNISGNAFTLSAGITLGAGLSSSIANDITFSGTGQTIQTQNTGNGTLSLGGSFNAGTRQVIKDGAGSNVRFTGAGESVSAGELRIRKGSVSFENGVSASLGSVRLFDATSGGTNPSMTVTGSSTSVSVSGDIQTGTVANDGRVNVSGGNLTVATLLTGQNAAAAATNGLYVSGGIVNVTSLRHANTTSAVVDVSAGTLNIGQATATASKLTEAGSGTINVGGTGNVVVKNLTTDASAAFQLATGAGNGILNLGGGTFETGGFIKNITTGTTTINLNGGTLRAGQGSTGFLPALANTSVNVGDGGAVIDTNGFNITVAAPLLDAGTGGLAKSSTGTLTLAGLNTFRGDTSISAGSVTLADTGSLTFYLGTNTSNRVNGSGSAAFDGTFRIDFASAAGTSWNLVAPSVASSYVGLNGLIDTSGAQTFVNSGGGLWSSAGYVFDEATGSLTSTAIPEPSSLAALAGLAALGCAGRRRRRA
jgi:autotransporter-associated beta strand protein